MDERQFVKQSLEQGDGATLRQLFESNASLLQWASNNFITILHSAVEEDFADVVDVLIHFGADVNAKNTSDYDWTPLHTAAWYGAPRSAEILLDRGADPSVRDKHDYTPMYLATKWNGIPGFAVLGVLLKSGAEMDLMTAVELKQYHVVNALINTHPDCIKLDPNADDLLPISIKSEKIELIQLLIDNGANVNACRFFDLPLIAAMSTSSDQTPQIMKYLLDVGADPNLKQKRDQPSPLEWAQLNAPHLIPLLSGE